MSTPPPIQVLWIAANTGFRQRSIAVRLSCKRRTVRRNASLRLAGSSASLTRCENTSRSSPAQKCLPLPARMTARTAGSSSSHSKHCCNSVHMGPFIALALSGRFRQTVATCWSRLTARVSKLGSMGIPVLYDYEGREIRLCCKGCVKMFEANPGKYIAGFAANIQR